MLPKSSFLPEVCQTFFPSRENPSFNKVLFTCRRGYAEDKRPPKRLFTPEIKRFLKDWLIRRRDNPYPNRDEKKMLAVQTGLTYIQVILQYTRIDPFAQSQTYSQEQYYKYFTFTSYLKTFLSSILSHF